MQAWWSRRPRTRLGWGGCSRAWGWVRVDRVIRSSRAVDPQLIPINRRVDGIAPVHVAVGVDLLRVGVN